MASNAAEWFYWQPANGNLTITLPNSVAIAALWIPNEPSPITVTANGVEVYVTGATTSTYTAAEAIPLPAGTTTVVLSISSSAPNLYVYATSTPLNPAVSGTTVVNISTGLAVVQVAIAQAARDGNTAEVVTLINPSSADLYYCFVTSTTGRGPLTVPTGITQLGTQTTSDMICQLWEGTLSEMTSGLGTSNVINNFTASMLVEISNSAGTGTVTSATSNAITLSTSANISLGFAYGKNASAWLLDGTAYWQTIATLQTTLSFYGVAAVPTPTHLGFTAYPSDVGIMVLTLTPS
jgi:hypothetical protein